MVEGQYISSLWGVEINFEVDCTIYSDACTTGWDAHDKHHTINRR